MKYLKLIIILSCIPLFSLAQENNSIVFNGDNSYVEASGINLTTNTLTLEAWIKPDGIQKDWTGLVVFDNSPSQRIGLMLRPNNELGYMWKDSNGERWGFSSGLNIPENKWTHIALIISPTKAVLVTNGKNKKEHVKNCDKQSLNITAYIGRDKQANRNFKGMIDEVRIWDKSLSLSDIKNNMNKRADINTPNLFAYWTMDDKATTLTDIKGNHNGELNNISYTLNDNPSFEGNDKNMELTEVIVSTPKMRISSPGSKNVPVLCINVKTSGLKNPLTLSEIKTATDGTTAATKIIKTKLLYSGNQEFSVDNTQIGTDQKFDYNITFQGEQELKVGNNFFWITYDIAPSANFGDMLDAQCSQLKIGGQNITPKIQSPEGNIELKKIPDYTTGTTIWFNKPNSFSGSEIWKKDEGGASNPDGEWERKSLPIGNGNMGANILGSVEKERITFNEKTLWEGGPHSVKYSAEKYWDMNKNGYTVLKDIQQALLAGNKSKAAHLTSNNFNGKINYYDRSLFGTFTTMGEFIIETDLKEDEISNYTRTLSLDSAIATVQFVNENSIYQRQFFCSQPDNIMAMRFSATEKSKQNIKLKFVAPHDMETKIEDNQLIYIGKLAKNEQKFVLRIVVRNEGGDVKITSSGIAVNNANSVTFIVTSDTDYALSYPEYKGEDPEITTNETINSIKNKSFSQLKSAHYEDYNKLYSRVNIDIKQGTQFDNIPTPERLKNYREGTLDHKLEETYFQFGRYLLIASSRPGNLPANLQGVWSNRVYAPWSSDYHNNINVQMNYWPAGICNLSECQLPLIDYIESLIIPGQATAKSYYNARGWTAAISGNIYGFTAPLSSGAMSWNYNPVAGPWLASHVWDYFEYTQDLDFLRDRGYEIIKQSAQFTVDHLFKHPNGTYTATPSYSPEHGDIDIGCTYNHGVSREILFDAIQASTLLDIDKEERENWKKVWGKISPYKIGKHGQLQEWFEDIDDPNDHHRHVNHLFALHPGRDISPIKTPKLAKACETTLNQRGDGATGWSMGWKINQWARLHDGDRAYKLFQNLLKNGTADNLWDMHPPFQIDGNFGGTAGVAEMFIQSHTGEIILLPALPTKWKDGEVNGLCARGNFVFDIKWNENQLKTAEITSKKGGECTIRYKDKTIKVDTKINGKYIISFDGQELSTKKIPIITNCKIKKGEPRQVLKIKGVNLNDKPVKVFIKDKEAEITAVTDEFIVIKIPDKATDGKITVKTANGTATSDFEIEIIKTPHITKIDDKGSVGQTISITGTNLEYVDKIEIGNTEAPIITKTYDKIVFRVPEGAVKGKIILSVDEQKTETDVTFTVTSIELKKTDSEIKVLPNPNKGIFKIHLNDKIKKGTIKIESMSGIEVYNKKFDISKKDIEVNVSDINSGIYILLIEGRGERLQTKVIINK